MQAGCGWDQEILRENLRAKVEIGTADGWIYVAGVNEGDIDGVLTIAPPGYGMSDSCVVILIHLLC